MEFAQHKCPIIIIIIIIIIITIITIKINVSFL